MVLRKGVDRRGDQTLLLQHLFLLVEVQSTVLEILIGHIQLSQITIIIRLPPFRPIVISYLRIDLV